MNDCTIPQDIPLKRCSKCKEFKPATSDFFHKLTSSSDGMRSVCITCRGCVRRPSFPAKEGYKQCRKCFVEKPATTEFFHAKRSRVGGLAQACKICTNKTPILVARDGHRICTKCKEAKPATIDFFPLRADSPDGFRWTCRDCNRTRANQWNTSNAERRANSVGAWRAANTERIRETLKKWHQKNPDYKQDYNDRYRQENLEKLREYDRNRARDSKRKKWRIEYRQRRPDVFFRIGAQDRARHRDKYKMWHHAYNTRKRSLPFDFTPGDWMFTLDYFGGRCAYCGNPQGLFRNATICMEHFISLSDPACPGTIKGNIVPGCAACNNSKRDRPAKEWLIGKFGQKQADTVLSRVQEFFSKVRQIEP